MNSAHDVLPDLGKIPLPASSDKTTYESRQFRIIAIDKYGGGMKRLEEWANGPDEVTHFLNEDGSGYIRFRFNHQVFMLNINYFNGAYLLSIYSRESEADDMITDLAISRISCIIKGQFFGSPIDTAKSIGEMGNKEYFLVDDLDKAMVCINSRFNGLFGLDKRVSIADLPEGLEKSFVMSEQNLFEQIHYEFMSRKQFAEEMMAINRFAVSMITTVV